VGVGVGVGVGVSVGGIAILTLKVPKVVASTGFPAVSLTWLPCRLIL
jgi:hypothetical protein